MALATNTTPGEIHLNGDLHGSNDPLQPELTPTGVTPGVYNFPNIVVNSKGQILSIEEYNATDVPCATKTSCGIVKIGSNLTVTNGVVDYLGDATTSSKGTIQVGSGFEVTNGVLDLVYPTATDVDLGVVKVPTSGNLDVDASGNISVPIATDITVGIVQVPGGDGLVLTSGSLTFDGNNAVLPIATTNTTGVIQVPGGDGLSVDGSGSLTVLLSDATASSKGVVQIGNNIDVSSGVISVADATAVDFGVVQIGNNIDVSSGVISLPPCTTSSLGVTLPGTNFDITNGILDVLPATTFDNGVVEAGYGFNISSGVLSFDSSIYPDATTSSKGLVQIGNNIDVSSGVIDIPLCSYTTKGVVQIGNNLAVSNGVVSFTPNTPTDATTSSKGEVQIGNNIDVSSGVISVAEATAVDLGVVQIGNNIDISSGIIGVAEATAVDLGVVQIGNNIDVSSGVISVAEATAVDLGVVQIGNNIDVSNGSISISEASGTTTKGIVRSIDVNNITITAGDIDVGTNIAKLDTANTYTKAQNSDINILTYNTNLNLDLSQSNTFDVTLTGDTTFGLPSNGIVGGVYTIIIKQDITGNRIGTFDSAYNFGSGDSTLTTTANAVDVIIMACVATDTYLCQIKKDFQ